MLCRLARPFRETHALPVSVSRKTRHRLQEAVMEAFAQQLSLGIPRLSASGREIIGLLADFGGCIDCPDSFATTIHLRSRHQLARMLRREGLPQIEELCAWIKVLRLLRDWEHTHRSLYTMALDASLYPPTCYRLVKRITSKTWRQACEDAFGDMLVRFVNRCVTMSGDRTSRISIEVTRSA